MVNKPRITVIVNSYNYAAFLREAILSATTQSYANKEIIVVDDGSSDNSAEIIRSFGPMILPLFNERLGQARSCLKAVRYATGDFILFLDSDDSLLPEALAKIAEVCTPGVAKVQFQLLPVGPEGEVIGRPWPAMSSQSRQDLIGLIEQKGTYVSPPNSGNVHRADIFQYITDIDYESSIDGIPYLLAPLLGEVRQIARPLACYRYHANNLSEHGKLTVDRFALEVRRHKARLDHLGKIVEDNKLEEIRITDPDHHSFVLTREILMSVSAGERPGFALILLYLRSLIREKESPYHIVILVVWAIATQLCPDGLRRKLALYRSNPRARSVLRRN